MSKRKTPDQYFQFKDPYNDNPIIVKVVPIDKLSVISHQRKPSKYHINHLIASIEKIGFLIPIVVVEKKNEDGEEYLVIDGQHRFLAAKELGIRELPVLIVPQKLSQLMMNFNIEKELNIREKSYVAFNVYQDYLKNHPQMLESDPQISDSIEKAYYVTLGIAYEQDESLSGSSFEPLLKKCDFFLEEYLNEAYEIRKNRAQQIITSNSLVKDIVQQIKEKGKWHPYLYKQIVSFVNPHKRKKLPLDFDELFAYLKENLIKLKENPDLVLSEKFDF